MRQGLLPTIILLGAIILGSCSKSDDISENKGEQLNGPESWNVQLIDKVEFNNELSGRIINQDYEFSLFSNTSEAGNILKSLLYQSDENELFILRGEGENSHRTHIFPISNNEISPIGYELNISGEKVRQLNLIKYNRSNESYNVLYNLFTSIDSNDGKSNANSSTEKIFKQGDGDADEPKTIEEQLDEVLEKLASPYLNLFDLSFADIAKKLENLPEDVKNQLGKWESEILDFGGKIKKAFEDLQHFNENKSGGEVTEEKLDTNTTGLEQQIEKSTRGEYEMDTNFTIRLLDSDVIFRFSGEMESFFCSGREYNNTHHGINHFSHPENPCIVQEIDGDSDLNQMTSTFTELESTGEFFRLRVKLWHSDFYPGPGMTLGNVKNVHSVIYDSNGFSLVGDIYIWHNGEETILGRAALDFYP